MVRQAHHERRSLLTPFGLLFPGQGAQTVGMGKEISALPEALSRFDEADRILGFPLSKLCWEGPQEELTRTQNCQPALYVSSMAALAALEAKCKGQGVAFSPAAAAGLSLGEYSALAAAGAFSFQDGLKLVRLRGQAMEEAARMSQGTMASVMGLDLERISALCAEAGCEVANINAPGQIVISGGVAQVQAAGEKAKAAGAKRVVMLEVGGAFHSRLMAPAAEKLKAALETVAIQPPKYPVLSNVTADFHTSPAEIRRLLVEQLMSPVRWEGCMQKLISQNITYFLEVGTGTVLKGLLKRISPAAAVVPVGTAQEVQQAVLNPSLSA